MANILVVEDNPVTRKLVRASLTREGFTVKESENARQAIEAIAQSPPDLVLQDIVLPDMSGYELVGRLRATPGFGQRPIVAFTGMCDQEKLATAGFTDVLLKPVEPSRLVKAIRMHTARPPARGTSPENRKKLLLVDADAVRAGALSLHFIRVGYEVTTARDGIEALAAARQGRPDVVVTDVFLPQLDGFDLARALRRDADLERVRIVLVTPDAIGRSDRALAAELDATAVARTTDLT